MRKIIGSCTGLFRRITNTNLAQKLIRDIGSLKALWNYAAITLFFWTTIYGVIYYGQTCINTAINATATLCAWSFMNYIWAGHMDKRLNGSLPPPIGTTDYQAPVGSSDNPILAPEAPRLVDGSTLGGRSNG